MEVFFEDCDFRRYVSILRERVEKWNVQIWSYCLMPNHVHLIAVPPTAKSLSRAIGEAHRRYAVTTNRPRKWTGHLWQERFGSCAMDERHVYNAARYVLLNPVRAGLVEHPAEWPYSSAASHLEGRPDPLVSPTWLDRYVEDWHNYLKLPAGMDWDDELRSHSRSGRPLL